jgi:hypothetical protein
MTTTLTTTGITFNDGTTQTSAAAGGGFSAFSAYSASGSFTVPSGVTKIHVILAAGGGAGGGGNAQGGDVATGTGGRGGGAGVLAGSNIAVTSGQVIAFTVGAGGVGVDNGNGGTGGTSRFPSSSTLNGGYLEAYGGTGGTKPAVSRSSAVTGNVGTNGGVLRSVIEGTDNIWGSQYQFFILNYLPIFSFPAGTGTYTQWNQIRQMGQNQGESNTNGNTPSLAWSSTNTGPRMGAYGTGGTGSTTSGGVTGGCLILY